MKTRTDLINFLIEKYRLKRYLEIGLQDAAQNFDKIICEYKVSVDPDPNAHADFQMTSDDFFEERDDRLPDYFDLIFIDGLHHANQVKKDFENSIKALSPNGFIILHDCNPMKEEHTIVPRPTERGHWNGDVYKFVSTIDKDYFCTVDIDCGCGVFSGRGIDSIFKHGYLRNRPNWKIFNANRRELINLISWDEFVSSHSHV